MLAVPPRDGSVFQQMFAEHWEAFQPAPTRYQPPYYDELVAKLRACGHPTQLGSSEYRCLDCGQATHVVALSCTSSLCLRCAKVYADNWVSPVSHVLHEGGIDRPSILTVPAMFRRSFSQNAVVVLRAFMRGGAPCLEAFYRTIQGTPRQGGSITVWHTHGRNGQ